MVQYGNSWSTFRTIWKGSIKEKQNDRDVHKMRVVDYCFSVIKVAIVREPRSVSGYIKAMLVINQSNM